MTKQEILVDLVSIQTLYRRSQGERNVSLSMAVQLQFECDLEALIDDLRAECVAQLKDGAE